MTLTPGGIPRSGSVLHVGCGGDTLPEWLEGYDEVRLDIDPRWRPDILASMTDMGDIGGFDVVLSHHSLEHLYPHEAPTALREFHRVLKPGGYAAIFVPDLEGVGPTDEVLFESPAGPICGADLIYGLRSKLHEMPHMAHHSGYVALTLRRALESAGFARVDVRRLDCHNLFGVAVKA